MFVCHRGSARADGVQRRTIGAAVVVPCRFTVGAAPISSTPTSSYFVVVVVVAWRMVRVRRVGVGTRFRARRRAWTSVAMGSVGNAPRTGLRESTQQPQSEDSQDDKRTHGDYVSYYVFKHLLLLSKDNIVLGAQ